MTTATGNALIGQSGGPTAVINQSLIGCLEALNNHSDVQKVLGTRHGVRGIIEDNLVDLGGLSHEQMEGIAETPSAALGSSRDKPDHAYCEKILHAFKKNNIRYFFYIGGNDSSDTCRIVNNLARETGSSLKAFHVPKTIDNDLVENDHTPGYGSAARFVALACAGDNLDNKALPGVKINVVMGRHAGFLTAASVLGRREDSDGPHLVYVPEVNFEPEAFVRQVDDMLSRHGRCLVAVSEGIHDKDGTPMVKRLATDLQEDAHGNLQLSGTGALGDHLSRLVKQSLGEKLRVRADTFGYLQRCFPAATSRVDAQEAREVGRAAVAAAMSECESGSIALERVSEEPYRAQTKVIELDDVAAKTRVMPPDFLDGDCGVSEKFVRYAKPLVGDLPELWNI